MDLPDHIARQFVSHELDRQPDRVDPFLLGNFPAVIKEHSKETKRKSDISPGLFPRQRGIRSDAEPVPGP